MKNQAKYTSLCIGLLCAVLSGCAGPSVQGADAAQTEPALYHRPVHGLYDLALFKQ